MNYWRIEIWVVPDGSCKLERDLFKQLRKKDPFVYKSLEEKMIQYTQAPIGDLMKVKDLQKMAEEKNMWEMKFHLKKSEIRLLGCLTLENKELYIYYALSGFKKKEQKVSDRDKRVARGRIEEFKIYYQKNELQEIL